MSSCTTRKYGVLGRVAAILLFCLGMVGTLGIAVPDPFIARTCELGIFLLAAGLFLTSDISIRGGWILAAISLWGMVELLLGATVYPWATLDASLRIASYGAAAWAAASALRNRRVRQGFLQAFAWLGALLAVTGVLAHATSPDQVLWIFPSPYPDTWGPFLSRNNFAQFLEITLPVALWLGFREAGQRQRLYLGFAAAMLAAGLASASRAGACLLAAETVAAFILARREGSRPRRWFVPLAAMFILVAGIGTLLGRFADPDPLAVRREIFRSALDMIAAKPWTGYGLGTFAEAYPAFAVFDPGAIVSHAHSDWLEWAAEGGLGFAALWLVFAARLSIPAVRSIWGMGLAAVFLHALVDDPFARHGVAVWVFLLAGPLVHSPPRSGMRKAQDAKHYPIGALA